MHRDTSNEIKSLFGPNDHVSRLEACSGLGSRCSENVHTEGACEADAAPGDCDQSARREVCCRAQRGKTVCGGRHKWILLFGIGC